MPQQVSPAHSNQESDPTEVNPSSSSSSYSPPSEPTMDYSSWSPRSHRLNAKSTLIWKPKILHLQKKSGKLSARITSAPLPLQPHLVLAKQSLAMINFGPQAPSHRFCVHAPISLTLNAIAAKSGLSMPSAHGLNHRFAVADPTVQPNLQRISPRQTPPVSAPDHIVITLAPDFRTTLSPPQNLDINREKPTNRLCYSLDLIEYGEQKIFLLSLSSVQIFRDNALTNLLSQLSRCIKTNTGSLQSTRCIKTYMGLLQLKKPATLHLSVSAQMHSSPFNYLTQQTRPSERPVMLHSVSPVMLHSASNPPHLSNEDINSNESGLPQVDLFSNTENMLSYLTQTYTPSLPVTPVSPQLSHQPKIKKKKMNQAPTRRSQRLKERLQPSQDAPISTSAKAKTVNIPFVLDSPLAPMDANNVLQILEATGLHVTEQIDEMIQEALKQDIADNIAEQEPPSTPLHDPVPPLALPGEDLLL